MAEELKPVGNESTGKKKAVAPKKGPGPNKPSPARHEAHCKICQHPQRAEIEEAFLHWQPAYKIADDYGLADRKNIERHVRAVGLMERRRRNLRDVLDLIIERGLSSAVEIPASVVVQAVVAQGKFNDYGRYVERTERVDLNTVFEKMTDDELRTYAETTSLPAWFEQAVQSD